ncbi:hypothetical protein BCR44DRAFT_327298 [Catenaria anguillulae PL171]|uniref:Uncharacterized protein n=1 Tax=Catenaria anguillulae PL171 TaxID=765915 RepID=A0A1Y2HTT8_9FUNG|nr:hypothetical protein BCR44DRAFT_327298 [Catenaria anguillulae PL171]
MEQIVLGHASQGPAVQVEGADSPYSFDSGRFAETNRAMGRGPTGPGLPDHRAKFDNRFRPRLTVSGSEFQRKLMPAYFPLSRYPRPEVPNTASPSVSKVEVEVELTLDVINFTVKKYKSIQPPRRVVLHGVSALLRRRPERIAVVLGEVINIEPGNYKATLTADGERVGNFPKRIHIRHTRGNEAKRSSKRTSPYHRPDSPSSSPRSRRRRQTTTSPASVEASPDQFPNWFSPASSATASSSAHSSPNISHLDLPNTLAGFPTNLGSLDMSISQSDTNMLPHTQVPSVAVIQNPSPTSSWVQHTSASPEITRSYAINAHSAPMQPPTTVAPPTPISIVAALNVLHQVGLIAVPSSSVSAPAPMQPVLPTVAAQVPGHTTSIPMVSMFAQPQQSSASGPFDNSAGYRTLIPGPSYTNMVATPSLAQLSSNPALASMPIPAPPAVLQEQAAPSMDGNEVSRLLESASPSSTSFSLPVLYPNVPVSPDSSMTMAASDYAVQAWPPQASASLDPASGFEDPFSSAPSSPTAQPDDTEYLDWSFLEQQTSAAGLDVSTGDREYQGRLYAGFSTRSQQQG